MVRGARCPGPATYYSPARCLPVEYYEVHTECRHGVRSLRPQTPESEGGQPRKARPSPRRVVADAAPSPRCPNAQWPRRWNGLGRLNWARSPRAAARARGRCVAVSPRWSAAAVGTRGLGWGFRGGGGGGGGSTTPSREGAGTPPSTRTTERTMSKQPPSGRCAGARSCGRWGGEDGWMDGCCAPFSLWLPPTALDRCSFTSLAGP